MPRQRRAAAAAGWLFALAIGIATADARAGETCRCGAASFSWAGCAASGSCDAGQWTGCTPTSDDAFAIGAGCHVSVSPGGDVLLAPSEAGGVTIAAGGALSMRGPVELRLGPDGLAAAPGSSIALEGCFRELGPDGGCGPVPGPALFEIGRVVPCRDGQCDGDAHVARIAWDAALDPRMLAPIDRLLARVDPGRDVLCFWQRSESGPVGADAGYCYDVLAVGRGPGARTLDFDARGTWSARSDQAGAPLARRGVVQVTLADAAPAAARTLRFAEPSLVEGRAAPVGRWLRCGGSQRTHLVASAQDDAAGDTLLLADEQGTAAPLAAGTRCHVDWGWSEGDVAYVMAPVHVTSAVNQTDRAGLLLAGATALRAVVADGLGGGEDASAIDVRGGPLVALEHVWVVDPLVTDTAAVLLEELPCGSSLSHLTVTGGPASAAGDRNYALAWFDGAECQYFVRHLYTRFMGDDNFVLESEGKRPVGAIDLRWVHAGPSSLPGDSGQFLDFGTPNATSVQVHDALCTACTTDDGFGSLVIAGTGPGTIDDLLWVTVRNGGVQGDSLDQNGSAFRFRRLAVVGSHVNANVAHGTGTLTGVMADQFYVRDVVDPRWNPHRLCTGNPFGARSRDVTRGVFLDVALGDVPCVATDLSMSDVYFVDVGRIGAQGPLLEVTRYASAVRLARITMAFRRPPAGVSEGVWAAWAEAAPVTTLDGPLLTGFRGARVQRAMSLGTETNAAHVTWRSPACFWDNDEDDAANVIAAYAAPPLRGVDPRFVDPASLRFDLAHDAPLRAVGCGASEAGIRGTNWAHRKTKLQPIYVGTAATPLARGAESGIAVASMGLLRLVSARRRRS